MYYFNISIRVVTIRDDPSRQDMLELFNDKLVCVIINDHDPRQVLSQNKIKTNHNHLKDKVFFLLRTRLQRYKNKQARYAVITIQSQTGVSDIKCRRFCERTRSFRSFPRSQPSFLAITSVVRPLSPFFFP